MNSTKETPIASKLLVFLPGLLVAATGVGAGDLATASFTGSQLGVAVLWAVAVGGLFKFTLTEGLARWQLATGSTFLEGVIEKTGPWLGWLFLPYLLLWTFFVGSALMSASGATLHAMTGIFTSAVTGKIVFGLLASAVGLLLVSVGGFKLFEKVMMLAIGIMFVTVLVTAALLWPGTDKVISGLLVPVIPDLHGEGLSWTIALIGGVGGTLTILGYGYWIKESGRVSAAALPTCRIDLASGYIATVLFGMAMVIIGSSIKVSGSGAGLLIALSTQLQQTLGPVGRWLFLLGAFCAIFSSLLGVWQVVPYLFADLCRLLSGNSSGGDLTRTRAYRFYLWGLALVPVVGLWFSFKEVQKLYAIIGAGFMPLLAIGLLLMNGNKNWLGRLVNGWSTRLVLISTLGFFSCTAWLTWVG